MKQKLDKNWAPAQKNFFCQAKNFQDLCEKKYWLDIRKSWPGIFQLRSAGQQNKVRGSRQRRDKKKCDFALKRAPE